MLRLASSVQQLTSPLSSSSPKKPPTPPHSDLQSFAEGMLPAFLSLLPVRPWRRRLWHHHPQAGETSQCCGRAGDLVAHCRGHCLSVSSEKTKYTHMRARARAQSTQTKTRPRKYIIHLICIAIANTSTKQRDPFAAHTIAQSSRHHAPGVSEFRTQKTHTCTHSLTHSRMHACTQARKYAPLVLQELTWGAGASQEPSGASFALSTRQHFSSVSGELLPAPPPPRKLRTRRR